MSDKPEGGDGRGRPSIFTTEVAATICARLADGETLRAICRDENMPHESTVRHWALNEDSPFFTQYAKARAVGYAGMAEELLEIADDGTNDYVERERENGTKHVVFDGEHVQRSRLRVDTRKWLLSKALPKVYGDKIEQTTKFADENGNPTSPLELARGLAFVLASAQQATATPPIPGTSTSNSKGD